MTSSAKFAAPMAFVEAATIAAGWGISGLIGDVTTVGSYGVSTATVVGIDGYLINSLASNLPLVFSGTDWSTAALDLGTAAISGQLDLAGTKVTGVLSSSSVGSSYAPGIASDGYVLTYESGSSYWRRPTIKIQTDMSTITNGPFTLINFISGSGITISGSGYTNTSVYDDGYCNLTITNASPSDKRLKENIILSTLGIETLNKLKVCEYNFITDPAKNKVQGLIAQDVIKVHPAAVTKGGKDAKVNPWLLSKQEFIPLIIKSIQDLSKENKELKKIIIKLEKRIERLDK